MPPTLDIVHGPVIQLLIRFGRIGSVGGFIDLFFLQRIRKLCAAQARIKQEKHTQENKRNSPQSPPHNLSIRTRLRSVAGLGTTPPWLGLDQDNLNGRTGGFLSCPPVQVTDRWGWDARRGSGVSRPVGPAIEGILAPLRQVSTFCNTRVAAP